MLMAGLDGIANKIEPPKPIEADLYELEGEEAAQVKDLPGSLPRFSMPWRPTTTSCSRGTSSPPT